MAKYHEGVQLPKGYDGTLIQDPDTEAWKPKHTSDFEGSELGRD